MLFFELINGTAELYAKYCKWRSTVGVELSGESLRYQI